MSSSMDCKRQSTTIKKAALSKKKVQSGSRHCNIGETHPDTLQEFVLDAYISNFPLQIETATNNTFYFLPSQSGWFAGSPGTYLDCLGLNPKSTQEEIKSAYKKLSVKYNPDKNPRQQEKATALFQKLKEAYECLLDQQKRVEYDRKMGLTPMFATETNRSFFGRGSFSQQIQPFSSFGKQPQKRTPFF